jgi:sterol desaturase/sphingolipid hydroxylase (fatty acid hydroxylase superfamily)
LRIAGGYDGGSRVLWLAGALPVVGIANALLDVFAGMSAGEAAFWLLVENVALFVLSLAFGHALLAVYRRKRVVEEPGPVEWREIAWAANCVVLNTVVTIAGWWLWRKGIIVIRRDAGWMTAVDVLVLLLAMDLGMYITHRMAHIPALYRIIHATHHRYDKPRPLNLFVLNPLEVLGFGALWLGVIAVYHSSWMGMLIYLALNLLFGTVGHLGVEPLPRAWAKWPILRHIGTATFHARHHQDGDVNFGFYTDIWDRMFRTLYRKYTETFGQRDAEAVSAGANGDRAGAAGAALPAEKF